MEIGNRPGETGKRLRGQENIKAGMKISIGIRLLRENEISKRILNDTA